MRGQEGSEYSAGCSQRALQLPLCLLEAGGSKGGCPHSWEQKEAPISSRILVSNLESRFAEGIAGPDTASHP